MITRILAVAALLTTAALTATGQPAFADQTASVDHTVSAADIAAVRAVAADRSTVAAVGDFLAELPGREGRAAAAQAPAVTVRDGVIPVYALSARFVSGVAGARPGELAYLAVPATAEDGRSSTIQAVRGADGTWSVGNLASGDLESRLATKLPAGATLLHEPQVNAWYAVRGDRLTVLEAGGGTNPVGRTLAVADYQRAVAKSYGDKQSGSDYAVHGKAGGYAERPATGGDDPVLPLLGLGGLVLLGGAAFATRSARRG